MNVPLCAQLGRLRLQSCTRVAVAVADSHSHRRRCTTVTAGTHMTQAQRCIRAQAQAHTGARSDGYGDIMLTFQEGLRNKSVAKLVLWECIYNTLKT